jgi:ABC-type transport system involved in multi-copper enzyme maturation permease subunit
MVALVSLLGYLAVIVALATIDFTRRDVLTS